jgi:transposase
MLAPDSDTKIYLFTGLTDMRKGIGGLSLLAPSNQLRNGAFFVFRGRSADKLKILWWDGQGFCLFYKRFEKGRFIWPSAQEGTSIGITRAQLAMLLEGIDWRMPKWSNAPQYAG